MDHKIIVEVTGSRDSQNQTNSPDITGMTSESFTGASGSVGATVIGGGKTSATSMLSKIGIAYVATTAVRSALAVGNGIIGRLGSYTGNTLLQNDVDNVKKGWGMAAQFVTDPIGFGVKTIFAEADFNLNKYKQNLEAGYKSYQLNYEPRGVKL